MLRVLGSPKKLCHGFTRRDLLRIGGLGLAGLALPDILRLQKAAAEDGARRPASFGKAKSLILMHLYGSPSQLEWADPKPEAPVEVRGELGTIPSSLPGCGVCELLPHFAQVMDRTTVLRSMTHPYPIHGVAYALTGVPQIDVAMELRPHDAGHWPFVGSVVQYVESGKAKSGERAGSVSDGPQSGKAQTGNGRIGSGVARRAIPPNLALPFPFSSRRKGEVPRAGPYAAFLGRQYDPVWTDFEGQATKAHKKTLQDMVYDDNDPYIGVSDDCRFRLSASAVLPDDVTLDRLDRRRSLVEQFNHMRPSLASAAAAANLSKQQETALALLTSNALGEALDVRREPEETRELYGHTLFGQACLAARRACEAGGRVVTVFWDEFGLAGTGWDTHWDHYPRMKNELCPGFDKAWYGLITDLDRRGLLDDVLVVCTSEHGRTPKLNSAAGGGRDHWSSVYTSLMAGAGVKRGHIVGASDKHGAEVADRPISPKDLLATAYHLLGIDHGTVVHDRVGRPLPLVDGHVIDEALV
jgi:hypothetical protein